MRKGFAVALGAGAGAVAAGAAAAVYWLRRATPQLATGTFPNGMGYARLGGGAKSLLWIGGPSIGAPKGMYLTMMTRILGPFVQDGYTVWIVGQKPNLPDGCTVADMAGDYAGLIAGELDGKVDLLVGDSTGGMIGFCLAALHPGLFGHIAIVVAGYSMTEAAKAANLESAGLVTTDKGLSAARFAWTVRVPESVRPSNLRASAHAAGGRASPPGVGQMMRLGVAGTREAAGRVPRPRTSFVGRGRELGAARRGARGRLASPSRPVHRCPPTGRIV